MTVSSPIDLLLTLSGKGYLTLYPEWGLPTA